MEGALTLTSDAPRSPDDCQVTPGAPSGAHAWLLLLFAALLCLRRRAD